MLTRANEYCIINTQINTYDWGVSKINITDMVYQHISLIQKKEALEKRIAEHEKALIEAMSKIEDKTKLKEIAKGLDIKLD